MLSTGTAAKSGWLGDWGASARTVVPQTHGLHVGPAQQRYGEYFTRVLRWSDTPGASAQQAVVLSQIVFSGFELLNLSAVIPVGDQWLEDDRPFLVVFQCGKRVWAGFPETLVRGAVIMSGKAFLLYLVTERGPTRCQRLCNTESVSGFRAFLLEDPRRLAAECPEVCDLPQQAPRLLSM